MIFSTRLRHAAAATTALCFLVTTYPVVAQEIADTHLRAARAAISAIGATDQYDMILPEAAFALKGELIQKNPDLQALINQTVDQHAFTLAARRADLEREAALSYARNFSEEELNQIAEFYASEAGQKLIEVGPIVTRDVERAAQIWQNGVARDLAQNVGRTLQEEVGPRGANRRRNPVGCRDGIAGRHRSRYWTSPA
jgi:uncharacterized protein